MYFIIKCWHEVLVEAKSLIKVNQGTKTESCKRICRRKKPRNHKVGSYLQDKKKLEKEVNLTTHQMYTIYCITYIKTSACFVSVFQDVNRI